MYHNFSRSTSPPEQMSIIEHQLELEVGATSDLCRQLFLGQEHSQKFLQQQFNEVHVKLNDLLILLPAQRSVVPLPDTASLHKNSCTYLLPFDEDILDKAFSLQLAPTQLALQPDHSPSKGVQTNMMCPCHNFCPLEATAVRVRTSQLTSIMNLFHRRMNAVQCKRCSSKKEVGGKKWVIHSGTSFRILSFDSSREQATVLGSMYSSFDSCNHKFTHNTPLGSKFPYIVQMFFFYSCSK